MRVRNHYVYITAGSVECYREQRGGLELTAAIVAPRNMSGDRTTLENGIREFEAHLDRHPRDRYVVITDTQAEAYQAETVPVVSRRDMKLLLNRKLEQRYRSTCFRAVVPHRARPYAFLRKLLRRRARTTTRILYALIHPESLAPWLEALERRAMHVSGLHSLGTLMPALMSHLKLPADSDALVVLRTAAGYRHAFVSPSGLRFSRLCAHSHSGDAQLGQEIDKTLQYLTMARLWGVDNRHRMLNIAVIDAQPSSIALTVPGGNLRTAHLTQLTPRDLAPHAPAVLLDAPNSAWLLFNRAALKGHGYGCATGLKLQDAGRRAGYRFAAIGTAAAATAVSAGYVALNLLAARDNAALASTAELIAEHVNATALHAELSAPVADLEPDQLRAVVLTRERLLARSINATGLLQRTATALAPYPDLHVDLMEWSYAEAPAAGTGTGMDATSESGQVPSNTIVLRVAGHSGENLRKADANAAVTGLAAALAHELKGRPSVEKLPFDVAPGGTLIAQPRNPEAAKTDFSVTVAVAAEPKRAS